jgi:hypothetical protein
MTMKNDLAFILAHNLNMYEQQTSQNPNLPLRFLFYIAQEYQKLANLPEVNLYYPYQMHLLAKGKNQTWN